MFRRPTNQFLKTGFVSLETDVLKIVKTSLLSGTFPKPLKTAVVNILIQNSYGTYLIIKTFNNEFSKSIAL